MSHATSRESLLLGTDDLGEPSEEQHAIVQQCLAMKEQYKRARDKLLVALNAQSEELERLQAESHVLCTSVKVCCPASCVH